VTSVCSDHVEWVLCHQGMAHSEIAGGVAVQIWRVTVNVLNKQSWSADRGGPSAWGVGTGLKTLYSKSLPCQEMLHETLE
jgi:hypothetical protein